MDQVGSDKVQIGEHQFVSKRTILSHLQTYNLYYEGEALQLRHREEEGELIIEGLLNVFWGLRRPIRLQMQDEETSRTRPSLKSTSSQMSFSDPTENHETDQTLASSKTVATKEPSKDEAERNQNSTNPGRTSKSKNDLSGRKISGRRLGIRRVRRHRCSFNGHFYNHKTAVFTPAFGSVTNVRINSCMTTTQVMRVLLNKFKIENSPDEFGLYLVHISGERHRLKSDDHPLAIRVLQGPCEHVSKVFLMETDQVEEVTYDVAQYIKFEIPVLQSFITKLQEEEEREMLKLKRRYSEMKRIIRRRMRSVAQVTNTSR